MFALVADVGRYPEFLPWCVAARVRAREGNTFTADLIVAFSAFREQFTSRVNLDEANREITIEYLDGPFQKLTNRWHFVPTDDGGTVVEFDIDFSFKRKVLESLISGMFTRAIQKMTASFDARAHQLYGAKSAEREKAI